MTVTTHTSPAHLDHHPGTDADPLVAPLPHWFRFADLNPVTGAAYAASAFLDLPPFAVREVPVAGAIWDDLVHTGQAARVVDPYRWVSLAEVHDAAATRAGLRPLSGACPDCWGTLITLDSDGSCNGTLGAAMWCTCVDSAAPLGKLA